MRLGRAEGVAVIGSVLGQILANDRPEEARRVLRRSAEMYRKLGREKDAGEVAELIRRLGLG